MKQIVMLTVQLVLSTGYPNALQDSARVAKTSEKGLRGLAVNPVKPIYPAASLKANASGVAISDVNVDLEGRPAVEIVEAPDEHIAAAVKSAVSGWTFKPLISQGSAIRVQSKLTFYFRIINGKGSVFNPEEMPGGAEKPKPASTAVKPGLPFQPGRTVTPDDITVASITFQEFSKLTGAARPTIVDIGDRAAFKRGHQPGAINIPHDELIVRGPIELRGHKFVVIDCTQEELWKCKFAAHYLEDADVGRVALLQR